jgi:hypothetical protein
LGKIARAKIGDKGREKAQTVEKEDASMGKKLKPKKARVIKEKPLSPKRRKKK